MLRAENVVWCVRVHNCRIAPRIRFAADFISSRDGGPVFGKSPVGEERHTEDNFYGAFTEQKLAKRESEYSFDSNGDNGRARAHGEVCNPAAGFSSNRAVLRLSAFGKDADAFSVAENLNVRFERLFIVLPPGAHRVRAPQLK